MIDLGPLNLKQFVALLLFNIHSISRRSIGLVDTIIYSPRPPFIKVEVTHILPKEYEDK